MSDNHLRLPRWIPIFPILPVGGCLRLSQCLPVVASPQVILVHGRAPFKTWDVRPRALRIARFASRLSCDTDRHTCLYGHCPIASGILLAVNRVAVCSAPSMVYDSIGSGVTGGVVNCKSYPTISACGIDCGLCPIRYVKAGGCNGCTAEGPSGARGRWCAIARCAVRDHGYETCAECSEFPCSRLSGWDEQDSIVTHARTLDNLRTIRKHGLSGFLEQQQKRMSLLEAMLDEFDEGRSKGYCCLAAALLPVGELDAGLQDARREVEEREISGHDRKSRAAVIHMVLDVAAERLGVELKLRRLPRPSV